MALSPARRYFTSKWFWAGVALALLIFLPNLIWLVRHDFISYKFLQHIHARDVGEGRAEGFLRYQFLVCANLFAAPVWLIGLYCIPARPPLSHDRVDVSRSAGGVLDRQGPLLLRCRSLPSADRDGRRHLRTLADAHPPMDATHSRSRLLRGPALCWWLLLCRLGSASPRAARCATSRSNTARICARKSAGTRLVKAVAAVRDSLPADQQANLGILVGNYGEQGAIEMFGPAYHLPPPISMTNSAWLRGYPIAAAYDAHRHWVFAGMGQTATSRPAALPATLPTLPASGTKRASITRTFMSAVRRASPGRCSGKTTNDSAESPDRGRTPSSGIY